VIFGTLNPEKIWHELLQICLSHLPDVATVPWEIQKQSFLKVLFIRNSDYLCYLRRKQTVNHLSTLKMSPHQLVNCKTFSSDWRFVAFFQKLEAPKRASCGLSSVALKRTSCNVWLAMSQQVFRVTTFCVNTFFQSFSTLISRIVHHDVLKFSPRRNKPLPQASTCPYQYTRSSCSVPQTQY